MKEFYCGAVVPECDAHFTSESDDGILTQVAHHAPEAHGIDEVPADLVAQVRRNIREAA